MTLKKEYVEKEAAIDYLTLNMNWYDEDGDQVDDWGERKAIISDLLAGIPPADVKPVVRGEWKEPEGSECVSAFTDDFSINLPSKKCSVCGHIAVTFPRANFCPNCGADMTPMPEER